MLAQALGEYATASALIEAVQHTWMTAENLVTSVDPRLTWLVGIALAAWLGVRLFGGKR